MEVVSRKEAKERGLTRYFTGKACRHGHIAERQTSCGQCVICNGQHHERYKAKAEMVTAERLREVVHYEPETGEFRWKSGNNAGKIAGSINAGGYRDIDIDFKLGRLVTGSTRLVEAAGDRPRPGWHDC